jgi:hypothetical protein
LHHEDCRARTGNLDGVWRINDQGAQEDDTQRSGWFRGVFLSEDLEVEHGKRSIEITSGPPGAGVEPDHSPTEAFRTADRDISVCQEWHSLCPTAEV